MAKADRLVLEEFVRYVSRDQELPMPEITYATWGGIGYSLGFFTAFFKPGKLIFNARYFAETRYSDILHEIGHYKEWLANKERYSDIPKEEREKYAKDFEKQYYTKYSDIFQDILKKYEKDIRHFFLKYHGSHGLTFWIPGQRTVGIVEA